MTLNDLTQALAQLDPDLPLRLTTPEADFGNSYHLTEVTIAQIEGFDCATNLRYWREVGLHVRDANGGPQMSAGKLSAILTKATETLDDITSLPLHIAAAPGNLGVQRFTIAGLQTDAGEIWVSLKPEQTVCKALMPTETTEVPQNAPRTCCA